MFGEIQIKNEQFHNILDIFEKLIKEYKMIINTKDYDGFNNIFTEALQYSKEDSHYNDSYKYFYEFMKILKKEK